MDRSKLRAKLRERHNKVVELEKESGIRLGSLGSQIKSSNNFYNDAVDSNQDSQKDEIKKMFKSVQDSKIETFSGESKDL